jgi:uncharacterized protein YpmS
MSKISPLISHYLQQSKSLNLEGYGRFFVDNNLAFEDNNEKVISSTPIQYEYNPNAKTDEAFITFIVKETGKIKPLAIADLDTFLSLGKQLLNISKPLVIDGLGTLNKATAGNYEFIGGIFEPPKINTDNDRDRRIRESKEPQRQKAVSFERDYVGEKKPQKGMAKKVLGALTLLVLLGGAGYAIYTFLIAKDENNISTVKKEKVTAKIVDTTTQKKELVAVLPKTVLPDSLGRIEYKVVVNVLDKIAATSRVAKLQSFKYNPIMYSSDSVNYKVAFVVKSFPQDSVRIKDSIQRNFITPSDIRDGKIAFIEQ